MSDIHRPRRRAGLSPSGRRKFGEWLANRLMIAAGAFFALVAVPGLIGPRGFSNLLTVVALIFSLVAAAMAIWVYYVTAERPGEPKGDSADE